MVLMMVLIRSSCAWAVHFNSGLVSVTDHGRPSSRLRAARSDHGQVEGEESEDALESL